MLPLASKDTSESCNITTTHLLRPHCVREIPRRKPCWMIFIRNLKNTSWNSNIEETRLKFEEEYRIKSLLYLNTKIRINGLAFRCNSNSSQRASFLLIVVLIDTVVNSSTYTSSNCLEVCALSILEAQNNSIIKLYHKIG